MSKSKFSSSEWEIVKDAPYWVYQALSKSDGNVSIIAKRKESKAFDSAVSSYRTSNALVKEMKANDEPAKMLSMASEKTALNTLANIVQIVGHRATARDLKSMNLFLMDIANQVAESVDETVIGRGERISKKEAATLEKIEAALGAPLEAIQAEERREKVVARKKKSSVSASSKKEAQKKAKLAEMKKREIKMKEAAEARKAAAAASKRKQSADLAKTKQAAAAAKVAAAKKEAEEAEKERIKAEALEELRAKRAKRDADRRLEKAKATRAKVAQEKAAADKEAKTRAAAKAKWEADQRKLKAENKAKWEAEQKVKEENRKKWMAEQAEKEKWMGTHKVAAGDSLGAIALQYYGSAAKHLWMRIYEANKDIIGDNPSMIQIGQELRIPK